MFDFFGDVLGYIEVFFNYVLNIIEAMISFFALVPNTMTLPLQLVGYVPTIVGTAITSVLAVGLIKLIIKR